MPSLPEDEQVNHRAPPAPRQATPEAPRPPVVLELQHMSDAYRTTTLGVRRKIITVPRSTPYVEVHALLRKLAADFAFGSRPITGYVSGSLTVELWENDEVAITHENWIFERHLLGFRNASLRFEFHVVYPESGIAEKPSCIKRAKDKASQLLRKMEDYAVGKIFGKPERSYTIMRENPRHGNQAASLASGVGVVVQ